CSMNAQCDFISINGAELRIGMPKSDVLALLAEHNDLERIPGLGDDSWCIKSKAKQADKCGNLISFGKDKTLRSVSKEMASASGDDAAVLMATLLSALEGLANSGRTDLAFSTHEYEVDAHLRLRVVEFVSGKQNVQVQYQPAGG
ncbi:MAG: hypothetical protein ABSH32_13125, partial [Bryobacteraceae bacterium]